MGGIVVLVRHDTHFHLRRHCTEEYDRVLCMRGAHDPGRRHVGIHHRLYMRRRGEPRPEHNAVPEPDGRTQLLRSFPTNQITIGAAVAIILYALEADAERESSG